MHSLFAPPKLRSVLLLLVAFQSSPAIPQTRVAAALPAPTVTLRSSIVAVPMTLLGGRPQVSVTLNGKGPFNFLLDTGAQGTIISDSLAEELNLEILGQAIVGSPQGGVSVPANLVRVARLELGDAVITDLSAVAADLKAVSPLFRDPSAPQGILSAKHFSGFLLTLAYPQSRVMIQRGELPAADGAEILDYAPDHRLLNISFQVAGKIFDADLDSGAPGGFTLPAKSAEQLPLAPKPEPVPPSPGKPGQEGNATARLNGSIHVGRFVFENPEIIFNLHAPAGNIGYEVLKCFSVTVDEKNHRVRLQQAKVSH
jgi:hypothetical protein